MNAKYIGFDIDSKKTVACVVQQGQKDRYSTLVTDLQEMQQYLQQQRQDAGELHLTFEISGEAGYRYDALRPLRRYADGLESPQDDLGLPHEQEERPDRRPQAGGALEHRGSAPGPHPQACRSASGVRRSSSDAGSSTGSSRSRIASGRCSRPTA